MVDSFELCSIYFLSDTKGEVTKDHAKNYIRVRPLLDRHLQRNRLL